MTDRFGQVFDKNRGSGGRSTRQMGERTGLMSDAWRSCPRRSTAKSYAAPQRSSRKMATRARACPASRRAPGCPRARCIITFAGKAELFSAWVATGMRVRNLSHMSSTGMSWMCSLQVGLLTLGERIVRMMMSPTGLTIYRLTVAEASKFPALARGFLRGWASARDRLHGRVAGGPGAIRPPRHPRSGLCRGTILRISAKPGLAY